MNRTTTHEKPKSDGKALQALRNMPDWLIVLLIVLLALMILGVALIV